MQNKHIDSTSALQYYRNLAAVIDWYAQHPEKRRKQDDSYTDPSQAENHNPVLEQAEQISIQDSAENFVTVFDLPDRHRKSFLKSWSIIQAHIMSEKLQRDKSPQRLMGLLPRMRNRAFKRAFPTPESLANTTEDPYKKVAKELIAQEARMRAAEDRYYKIDGITPPSIPTPTMANAPGQPQALITNPGFWWLFYKIVPGKIVGPKKTNNPEHFVKELKSTLRKGRILIALPGGYDTYNVVHTNFSYYDFGHAAVINKNSWEVNETLLEDKQSNYSITTGIPGPDDRVERSEELEGWMKHGRSFVGKVVNGYWKIKWSRFWGIPYPEFFWIKSGEVNSQRILEKSQTRIGTPYCAWYMMKTAKWNAPRLFICSTLPWWAAKWSVGKNLGDWWKSTIYPAGLYLSDYVRIVGETNPPKPPPPPRRTTTIPSPRHSSSHNDRYWIDYEKADEGFGLGRER